MIGKIVGKPTDFGKGLVIIETSGGVGYVIYVTEGTKNVLLKEYKECSIFTHTVVRNDTIELFGLLSQEEYSVFSLLLSVSGVGPKKALALLERVPTNLFLQAVQREDVDLLVSLGVGKQQAQRIVLDLHKKVGEGPSSQISADLLTAMVALGYEKKEVAESLQGVSMPDDSLEKQIQVALKVMRGVGTFR